MPHFPPSSRRQFLQQSTALLGLTLTGCGWTLAEVRQTKPPSSSADHLRIYTWSNYIDQKAVDEFIAQTGIDVTFTPFESNEAMLANVQAGGGRDYSVIYPSDYMVQQMRDLNLLQELDHTKLTGLENLLTQFQNPVYDPGNRHSVPVSWGTTGLVYNTVKLKDPVEDWDYLWQHEDQIKQRLTLINDVREVMGATLRSLGYSYNTEDPKHLEAAYQRLRELKPAIATFATDSWMDQMLSGDLLIAMCYSVDGIGVSLEDPNLKYVIPKSGASLWTDTMVIPVTAPNPEGAYAWINYMLQPSATASLCKRLRFATPNRVALENLPDELRNNTGLFPPDSILANCEGIAPVSDATSELFDSYWTRLTSS